MCGSVEFGVRCVGFTSVDVFLGTKLVVCLSVDVGLGAVRALIMAVRFFLCTA